MLRLRIGSGFILFVRLCTSLLLVFPAIGVGAVETTGLFSVDEGIISLRQTPERLPQEDSFPEGGLRGEASGELAPSPDLRSRIAAIDFGQLAAARSEVAQGRPSNLRLNLFTDAEFQAIFERTEPTASGHTLTGRLADDPLSTVVLAVNGDHIAGTVWSSGGIHVIHGVSGAATVRQLDSGRLARCEGSAMLPPVGGQLEEAPQDAKPPLSARGASSKEASAADDDGTTIDLLVVYPSFIRRYQGGHLAMRTLIDRDLAMANAALDAGGVDVRVALVAAVEVGYEPQEAVELGGRYYPVGERGELWSQEAALGALLELRDPSDGQLDEIHALRDSYAADLVLMHWGDREELGVAYQPESLSSSYWAPFGFAVSASIPFTHELGHNLGLMHDRANNPGNLPFPFSHGYVFDNPASEGPDSYGTIMSVSGEYLHRFSDPNQYFPDMAGVPLGVPGKAPSDRADGPADAVRSLKETRRMAANFRKSANRCEYRLSPEVSTLPAAGGKFNIRVETTPGCAWAAQSLDGFAAPLAGASSGVGSGELTYRVPANGSWEREGMIFIAGEAHRVKQAGSRPITPVCERAPAIKQELSKAVRKPNCAEISATDLANVRFLNMQDEDLRPQDGVELVTLKRGDFDGLSNLYRLHVWAPSLWDRDADGVADDVVGLTNLEAGAFDGLSNLHTLVLSHNSLPSLEPGAFSGLSNLRILKLQRNALTALAPSAFEEIPNLRSLELWRNKLTKLEPGTFAALHNLRKLDLEYNNLTILKSGAFAGLSKLQKLYLDNNDMMAIEPGAFADLSNLQGLTLMENNLTRLDPDAFDGLSNLTSLRLHGNSMRNLKPGQFHSLPNLLGLWLDDIGLQSLTPDVFDGLTRLEDLSLSHNRLTTLKANVFDRLPNLEVVDLSHNLLTTWERRLFSGDRLRFGLDLGGNRIRTLPPGAFEGLKSQFGAEINLRGNPGSPFISRPELVSWPKRSSAPNSSAEITVEVAEGALMDMRIGLSVSGGVLSAREVFIAQGAIRGNAVRVAPSGGQPVTVRVAEVPEFPTPTASWVCRLDFITGFCHRILGIRVAAGPPLVLHGFSNQVLAADDAVKFDLPTAFPDFGAGTSYAVESSDPAVVAATIQGSLLILSATGGGKTTLTVTATGRDGQSATLSFKATVLAPPEAIERIPDLSLAVGDSIRIEASDKFRDPGGDSLSYAAETSDSAVATASAEGSAVIVVGRAPGVAALTVTATDPDGLSATLSFKATVLAPPEAIERIPDLSLAVGDSIRIEASDKFRDPDGDSLSYAAETSDSAVATASVEESEGSTVIVVGRAPGVAALTLTATDSDGLSATLSFKVKVERPMRSRWGGWRSALLRLLSSEDDDES